MLSLTLGCAIVSIVILVVIYARARRRAIVAAEPLLTSRQQIRRAAREETYRQIAGAPVSRHIKRLAARSVARKLERNHL